MSILAIQDLRTSFYTYAGEVKAVDGISFQVTAGETVAIVGESGCGKSVTALSIMSLLPPTGRIIAGSIYFNGQDLTKLSSKEICSIRGNEISMIFQDPMTSLNPVLSIKTQIIEGLRLHQNLSKQQAIIRGIELMKLVGIPLPEERLSQYPHQFSGGMRQRITIAMAIACKPKVLIADEPTTALDVIIQAQILEVMKSLKETLKTAIILITHDLGVVAGFCQKVIVMYAGKIVEKGSSHALYYQSCHPYTWGLLDSIPHWTRNSKRKLVPIWGKPPNLLVPSLGCRFFPRCEYAMKICQMESPPDFQVADGHEAACWLLDSRAPQTVGFKSMHTSH